jgi:uncharacterized membrane protein SpoIIM required for sporulation
VPSRAFPRRLTCSRAHVARRSCSVSDPTNPGWVPRHPKLELERFEGLLDRSEKLRARGLPFDELRELSFLYRTHSARLSRSRDRNADPDAIRHLNGLCVRAYAFLYSAGASDTERRIWRRELPRLFRTTWRAVVLAWVLLLIGAALGASLTRHDPSALYAMLPVGFGYGADRIDRLWSSPEAREAFFERSETPVSRNLLFGSQLFTHNTRVGILSFATGMLAGTPSALLQLYNGMMLGAFGSVFFRDPLPVPFIAWLAPHGIPELTAITLCCAGGLVLGAAVAAPGRRRRMTALREDSVSALLLVASAVPLFLVAALTESFVRESSLGSTPRLAIAGVYAVGLGLAHWWLRRMAHSDSVDTGWLAALR